MLRRLVPLSLLLACSPSAVEGDRRVLRSSHGYQTVSMLDGGRTGLYYDVGEEAGKLRPNAHRVVLLGLGGGEMLRAARRALPAAEMVGVDVDPKVAAAAISDFGLLELGHVQVVVQDAYNHVAEAPESSIDLLFVDIFDDDQVPARFRGEPFFHACYDAMRSDGLFVMNVYPAELAGEVMLRLQYGGFRRVWRRGLIEGNVLVFAEP